MFLHLSDLESKSGISARTIRYYISRGLIPGPVTMGRKAHYTELHLQALQRIEQMRAEGKSLDQILKIVQLGGSWKSAVPDPTDISCYDLAPDVQVQVRKDAAPHRKRVINHALADFARAVIPEGEEKSE